MHTRPARRHLSIESLNKRNEPSCLQKNYTFFRCNSTHFNCNLTILSLIQISRVVIGKFQLQFESFQL